MKKLKKLLSLLITLQFILYGVTPVITYAGYAEKITLPTTKLDGYSKYTKQENLFRTEATPEQEFAILDSDENGFLVIANKLYGIKKFDEDGTQKFDIDDPGNIAYYLNNEFLQDEAMLPAEIKDYIDFERTWEIEPGFFGGNCPESYSVKCGVSLLSYTELRKYISKFGLQDDSNKVDWYLRSPLGTSDAPDTGIMCGGTYANEGRVIKSSTIIDGGVKPVFWLKKEFFKDVRLSIPYLGSDITKEVRKKIRLEEMRKGKAGYSDYELKRLGYTAAWSEREYITIDIPNAPTYTQNSKESYINVSIAMSGNESREYTVEYSPSGTFTDTVSQKYTVAPLKKLDIRLDLSKVLKNKYPNFTVRVISDEGVVSVDSKPITLMDFYEDQLLDEYAKLGINYHPDNKTTAKNFVEYYNFMCDIMGFPNLRSNHRWSWLEGTKGVRPLTKHKFWDDLIADFDQEYDPYILGYGNPVYYSGSPATYQNVTDTIDYNVDMIDYLTNNGTRVKSLEIWNEPNLPTFFGSSSWILYSQLANRMGFEMKNRYPDKEIIGCGIASQLGEEYIDAFYRRGGLMYSDGFSCHPYTYPNNPDVRHMLRSMDFISRRYEAGGWMTVSLTEIGYPTHTKQGGITKETQGIYLPKMLIYNDEMDVALSNIYVLENTGYDDTYNEHEFGIMEMDMTPKPAVASLAQLSKYHANAEYIGRFPINENGSYAYVYSKLGDIFAILWSVDEEFEYEIGKNTKAEDYFGNAIENKDGKIMLGTTPVYLSGNLENLALLALEDEAKTVFGGLKEEYAGKFDVSYMDEIISDMSMNKIPSSSELKAKIDAVYDYGVRLTEDFCGDDIKDLTTLLFKMHQFCQGAAAFYASYDVSYPDSDNVVLNMEKKISDKKGTEPESSLLFTDALMRYAKRYNKKSNEIATNYKDSFKGKNGNMAYCDLLAENVVKLAEKIMEMEDVNTARAIFTYFENADPTVYQGQEFKFGIEIENLRNADLKGEIVWKDANKNPLGEPTLCDVASGTCKMEYFKGTIPADYALGKHIFYVDIIENGKVLKSIEIDVTVEGIISMDLNPSEETVSKLSEITVDLTSTYNDKLMGTLEIEAPEGWNLENNSKRFVIDPGETQTVNIKVAQTKKVPYNEYYFGFKVSDHTGKELINKKLPLDFLVAVYADEEMDIKNFKGDISGWENAYPIYSNIPQNPEQKESWDNANIAMKTMLKWDDKYFYTLTDVYDDMYQQTFSGENLWRGDSIQLAFDGTNDKAPGFGPDDYEYGFSYTAEGYEVRGYYVGTGKTLGAKPAEWFMVVRDADKNITRYITKIPRDELAPLKLAKGNKFGFNVCANDADVLERDSYIQFTSGIADGKNPGKFHTFTMVGSEPAANSEENKHYGFETIITDSGMTDLLK